MTITRHKNVGQVTNIIVYNKNVESDDTAKNGIEEHSRTIRKADDGATTSCSKAVHCNLPNKLGAVNSTANGSEAIDSNTAKRHKEHLNAKLNLSKTKKSNVGQSTQTNGLKIKCNNGLQRERERAKEVDDKLRGKVIDLDKMINKNVNERGVQADKRDFGGNHDRLDYLRNRNINFIKLAEDDFAERTTKFRNMRDAMLNNFNQTINIMNEQYERRKSSQFRFADENRDVTTSDQYNATRYLQALPASSGRQL